jgi:hypothetical protein
VDLPIKRNGCVLTSPTAMTHRTCDSPVPGCGRARKYTRRRASCLTLPRRLQTIDGFVRNSGGVPERSKGADCKSAGSAFEGSNPSPSTRCPRPRAGGADRVAAARFDARGCSSMVEQKPSKLTTRVRFPSPAPALHGAGRQSPGTGFPRPCSSVVEHSLGKGEVARSIRAMGTSEFGISSGDSSQERAGRQTSDSIK